jgi:hypothetical protein
MSRLIDLLLGALILAIFLLIVVFTRPPSDPPSKP